MPSPSDKSAEEHQDKVGDASGAASTSPPSRVGHASQTAGSPIDWRRLHLWQIQPLRDALLIFGLFGLVYLGYLIRIVTVPLLLAMLLAYLVEPLVSFVTKRGWFGRPGAAVLLIVAVGALGIVPLTVGLTVGTIQTAGALAKLAANAGGVLRAVDAAPPPPKPDGESESNSALVTPEVDPQQSQGEPQPSDSPSAEEALATAHQLRNKLPEGFWRGVTDRLIAFKAEPDKYRERVPPGAVDAAKRALAWVNDNAGAIAATVGQHALGAGGNAFNAVVSTVGSIGMLAFSAFLTAFFFYFFSTGYGSLLDFWEGLVPERRKHRVFELVGMMDRVVSSFVRGRLTICLILGVTATIGYWIIGVPAAFVLGPVVGLLFLVPFVHVIGVPVAWILMTLDSSGPSWQDTWWWILFAPIGVYMLCQVLDDWILTPLIQGKNTGLDTPSILFASIAGGALAGVYGLLLAIPVAACVAILLREMFWPRFRQWAEGRARDPLPIG